MRIFRGTYEKQARAEVSQLMADMAPGDIREMNPKKFDEIAKKFARGEGVSRKDANELGLPPNWSKEQRNEVFSEWQTEKAELRRRRAKMDGVQEQALRDDIAGFVGEGPEAQRVYDRVVQNLKDATVLDDPTAREKLVMSAAEAVWNEDAPQRMGRVKQRAKAAERADHDARLAEAESQAAEQAQRAKKDAQERTNAEMMARETKRYNDFMLAREEARAKGGQNEAGANETSAQPDEAQSVTPPARETARPVEAGEAPSKVGGEVVPVTVDNLHNYLKAASVRLAENGGDPTNPGHRIKSATKEEILAAQQEIVDALNDPNPQNFERFMDILNSHAVANRDVETFRKEWQRLHPEVDLDSTPLALAKQRRSIEVDIESAKERLELHPNSKYFQQELQKAEKALADFDAAHPNVGTVEEEIGKMRSAPTPAVESPTSAPTEAQANTPPTTAESAEGASRANGAEVETLVKLADDTVPVWQKAVMAENEKDPLADHRVRSDFANKIAESVKDKSESEISQIRQAFREALYAKGNPMPGGYKPLLDAAEYAFDAAIAKGKVRLLKGGRAANARKKTARTVKSDTKSAESAKQTPETAAKKPFEERYREWAEEDAPVWAKDLSPEDKAEYERLLDDVMTEKGETVAEKGRHIEQAFKAITDFEKAHTPKPKRGRPKKVAAETKAPEAKVEPPKTEAAAEPDAPKGAKPDMKPVIAAMHKLGDLAMSDAATLEKALREAEARGQADRADNIRTFLDYKKSVGVNADPKSDKTQGGRYRASIESEKPLDDPKFRAWAKRRGAAPTQQKREEYDAAMVKQAKKRLSRWIKGVKVRRVNAISDADLKGDSAFSNIRPLRDGKRIVGSYNLKTGEVTLAKGALVETVAHELGWHAAFDWAKRNAATNERAGALYERMRSFADEAPDAVKAEIAALYGKLDADAFTDEVGAALFVRGQAEQFASAIDPMVDAPWYKKAWRTVVDIVKDWLSSRGMNRVDLDGVEEMSERRFSEFLATAMLSGKTLGERKGFSMDLDMSKSARWERKLSDRFAPIKELMERVEGNNGEAYRMARTLEGMAQMGKNRAERAMKRVDKILVANDISPELLAQYMQAMAYEERNAKIEKRNRKKDGSGMTQDSAEQIFAEIDERGVREKCQEAADILWKIQDEGLQARVDAGLIDQETADKWRKEEPHHVPWRDAIDPDTGEWMGRNYMGPEFDTAEGRSTSATGDPITIMLQEYENAYARAAENALRQNLADIARLNTDVGTIYDSIQVDAKGHRSFIKFPAKGEKAKMLAIPDGSKIESTKAGDGGMANILTYRENGETKYLALNGSLGEAIAAAVTGRSLSRPPAWLSKFMRGYAATATAWSPTFAIRNTMADHFDIHGNMVKDFGLLKGEKMYAKMVAEEVKMSKELLQYVHTGDFAHDANGKATTAFGKLVEEYEAAGGLIGGLRTEGYDVIQKRIRADFRSGRNKLHSVGRELAAGWTDLQKMSELSTRLAAFKVMKESGMSAKEAAMWSRESTVDFNKKGNWTPITNILWMFSNSALGSGVRQAKGLLTTKNGLQLATGLAAWGFIEGMLECAMNEGYDDEEEKRGSGTGADLNEYTRQNSAYLRFGDTVYRTNLHMGPYGIIKYAGNVAARVMSGRLTAEKAAKELGLTAAEVAAAFTGMGNVSADALLETGMPTALQPFVQGITGKDYAGRPLYRKKYDEAKPDSSHGRKSTAAGYQWLAKRVNEITGGDEYSKGGIDIAPETVKLITETAGKNFVRDIVNIVQTSARLMSGDNEPRNIPFVRDAVRKVDGNENRYYEALRRYDADKLKLKDPNLKGEERRSFLNAHPWLKSNGKKGSTVVSTLETRIKDLMKKEENPNLSDERKEELKALRRRLQARVIERMSAK
jgi:hypothetical protein